MNPITSFQDQYRFLSNFWASPILFGGVNYPTVEHYYQAQKTHNIEDRLKIANLQKASHAKQAGRAVEVRPDWDAVKIPLMRVGLCQKFHKGVLLRDLLLTGDAPLVEGNTWGDKFWGVCNGEGHNHLGVLLMEIRSVRLGQLTVALGYLMDRNEHVPRIVSRLIANDLKCAIRIADECIRTNQFDKTPEIQAMLESTIIPKG